MPKKPKAPRAPRKTTLPAWPKNEPLPRLKSEKEEAAFLDGHSFAASFAESEEELLVPSFPYRIVVERSEEDGAFVARVPALGAAGHGETEAEARQEAKVAAEGLLEQLLAEDRSPPASDVGP